MPLPVLWLLKCVISFCSCCDDISETNHLKEEGFEAHGLQEALSPGEGIAVGATPGCSRGIMRYLVHISAGQEAETQDGSRAGVHPQGLSSRYPPLPAGAHFPKQPTWRLSVQTHEPIVDTSYQNRSSHLGSIHCWGAWANDAAEAAPMWRRHA